MIPSEAPHYSTLFLDLDDTVYSRGSGLWQEISARIDLYLECRLSLSAPEAKSLRASYLAKYGTTLGGLRVHELVDAQDYLAFVHDVPIESLLAPDPALEAMLECLPQRKFIFTNASRSHAVRVLETLGIAGQIDGIIDVAATDFVNKPDPRAYHTALELAGGPPPRACVLVDDRKENLAPAEAMGMRVVLVGGAPSKPGRTVAIDTLSHLASVMPELLEAAAVPPPEPRAARHPPEASFGARGGARE